MSYQATGRNVKLTAVPWRWTCQRGEPGSCYQARVWDAEGDLLAKLEPKPDPVEAGDNARFIAAAGTAASKLPEERDPIAVMKALPDILKMAEWAVRTTKFRDEDGKAHPPDRELMVELRNLLNETRADGLAESDD